MKREPRSRSNGTGHGRRRPDFLRKLLAMLAEPLEQYVASQREARQYERFARVLTNQTPDHSIKIRGLAGVIEPTRARHLAVARPKNQRVGCPAAMVRQREQSTQVV
jgi:hypothetical protein